MGAVRRLLPQDDRSGFSCGEAGLDEHFRQRAGQQQFKQRTSSTYVSVDQERIVGFVTVVAGAMRRDELGEAQRGIGAALLLHVFDVAVLMARECGCVGVLVDAKAPAIGFYENYDFRWILPAGVDGTRRGFLSIRTIEAGLAPE